MTSLGSSTPVRRPASVRRTTSHDSLRPDGLAAPVTLRARGRDIHTDRRGGLSVLDSSRLDGVVTFPERVVLSLSTRPGDPRLAELVGVSTRTGFRHRLEALMPEEGGTVGYQLLDDLPTAILVSGVAVHAAGATQRPPGQPGPRPDLCAGYAVGGLLQQQFRAGGTFEDQPRQPAPSLERSDDPEAWHRFEALPPHSVRRVRRLDVWLASKESAGVESFFRDTHTDGEGRPTIVHEYTVRVSLDLATTTITACEADEGGLPWPECPGALGSAGRLVGLRVDELRHRVRTEFVGPTTCTHLNDVYRSLEGVSALFDTLVAAETPSVG